MALGDSPVSKRATHRRRQPAQGADCNRRFWLVPEYWGQGLATEAAQAWLRYGFEELGLAAIYAGADPPNEASLRVIERLGMKLPRRATVNGLEVIYYSLTRAEFQPAATHYHLERC